MFKASIDRAGALRHGLGLNAAHEGIAEFSPAVGGHLVLAIHTLWNRCAVLSRFLAVCQTELVWEQVLEGLEADLLRTPSRWEVDLVLESLFEKAENLWKALEADGVVVGNSTHSVFRLGSVLQADCAFERHSRHGWNDRFDGFVRSFVSE